MAVAQGDEVMGEEDEMEVEDDDEETVSVPEPQEGVGDPDDNGEVRQKFIDNNYCILVCTGRSWLMITISLLGSSHRMMVS